VTLIAIDGPAGSGKSTVAAALASRLGLVHVDTGAFYRAATLAVLRAGVAPTDAAACSRVVAGARISRESGRTWLDGDDVEAEIRSLEVTAAVSTLSAHPTVRAELVKAQRTHVPAAGAVVEGRDAGTAVVPDAAIKVWLTASVAERAARRTAQLGTQTRAGDQRRELTERDSRDAVQMHPAPDAIELDTTARPVEALVDELAQRITQSG
jgi:cytidylate kinase